MNYYRKKIKKKKNPNKIIIYSGVMILNKIDSNVRTGGVRATCCILLFMTIMGKKKRELFAFVY